MSRGFGFPVSLDRVVGGLAAVASALNEGNLCGARIAAVQLRIPDLSDAFAHLDMQLEDIARKLHRIAAGPREVWPFTRLWARACRQDFQPLTGSRLA